MDNVKKKNYKFCPDCGQKLGIASNFCNECGSSTSNSDVFRHVDNDDHSSKTTSDSDDYIAVLVILAGLLSIGLGWIVPLVGLVFGLSGAITAFRSAKKHGGSNVGVLGAILSVVGIFVSICAWLYWSRILG